MEESGLKLTLEGLQQALKGLEQYTRALEKVDQTTKKVEQTTRQSKGFDLSSSLSKTTQQLSAFNAISGSSIPLIGKLGTQVGSLGSAFSVLTPQIVAAGVALAGITAGAAAFFALGKRGAALEPTLTAFSNIIGGAEAASAALDQMRIDTRGTISDFELMRLSVQGLQGTSNEFRQVVGKDFGAILDVTQRVAQATGMSADIVREKFILGLRRQSVKLLDDVGVVVSAEEAYKRYAEAQGLAANSLNETQKQAAFATEALRQLTNIGNEIGQPAKALDLLKIPLVAITNFLDKLSLAIQPAFVPFLNIVSEVSGALTNLGEYVFPLVQAGAMVLGTVLSAVWDAAKLAIDLFLGPLFDLADNVFPYVAAAALIIADGVQAAFEVARGIVANIAAILSAIADAVGLNNEAMFGTVDSQLGSLATNLAKGGGRVVGAFAAGMLRAGTKVAEAAAKIAQIVADFLEGFSPPKVGPLSKIDEGGMHVAEAWAQGFSEGLMRPIEEVAGEVNDALGRAGLAGATSDMIEQRLGMLDTALQPFKDSLLLVKATVEQIAGFLDPALKIAERQRKAALEAFTQGKASAETVRALDEQMDRLNALKDAEEDRVDRAQLQLSLAQAQQAQERALLEIAKSRLPVEQAAEQAAKDAASAREGGAAGKTPTEKAASEAAAKKPKGGAGGAALEESLPPPLGGGGIPDLLSNPRIQAAKDAILNFAADLGGSFSQGMEESGYSDALGEFEASTGELGTQLGRIAAANPVQKIKDKFSGLETLLDAPIEALKTAWDGLFTSMQTIATTSLAVLQVNLSTALLTLQTLFNNTLGELGIGNTLITLQNSFVILEEAIGTSLSNIGTKVSTLASDVGTYGITLIGNLKNFWEASFETAKTNIVTGFEELKTSISEWVSNSLPASLANVGTVLNQSLINPFIDALNSILDALESAINSALHAGGLVGNLARDVVGLEDVSLGRIPRFEAGGMARKGLALVGERGPELINLGSRAQIFPADLTRALIAQAAPVPAGGNTYNTYNQQRSFTANFNNASPQQTVLTMRQLEAQYR